MKKVEQKFQSEFGKWLKYNWACSAAFELKIARGNTFRLKQIAEHQTRNLKIANEGLLYYKISDIDITCAKPFDCFTLCKTPSYIVVKFDRPRNKTFYLINIKKILSLQKQKKVSLTEEECDVIADEVGVLS